MARKKVTTLFNKNHISIVRIENDTVSNNKLSDHWTSFSTKKNDSGNFKASYNKTEIEQFVRRRKITYGGSYNLYSSKNDKSWKEELRLKSPLGFYYTKVIHHHEKSERQGNSGHDCLVWTFYDKYNTRYELSYYTRHGDTRIGIETRPWDIMDNSVFEDNYIEALVDEVNRLISISSSKHTLSNIKFINDRLARYTNPEEVFVGNLGEVKRQIFTDLFGYPDGPKHQTNNEKILSHGFDLKTSFRKM